jgi:hypothetical protein
MAMNVSVKPPACRTRERPRCNLYDNIYDIRMSGYPSSREVERVLTERPRQSSTLRLGRGFIYTSAEDFVYDVAHAKLARSPIWKVMIPRLDRHNVGTIYYVAEGEPSSLAYRATYGYWGAGPHEAALIEACLERIGLQLEVRDGGCLLGFFIGDDEEDVDEEGQFKSSRRRARR